MHYFDFYDTGFHEFCTANQMNLEEEITQIGHAWETADLDEENPVTEVTQFIKSAYPSLDSWSFNQLLEIIIENN